MIMMSFTNPQQKKSKEKNEVARGMGSLLHIQQLGKSCPEMLRHNGRSEMVHHVTGKLHFSHCVPACLNIEFPDHLVGRWGPIPWPHHFPDLTSVDFFLGVCKRHCSS
jgi:hypothetical protein